MFENRKRQKELELKADICNIALDHLPAEIREAFANDYVETIRKGKLIYSRDFYKAMLKHIQIFDFPAAFYCHLTFLCQSVIIHKLSNAAHSVSAHL